MRECLKVDPTTFLSLVEYLYTGHAPVDQEPGILHPLMLLEHASKYGLTRLVALCEVCLIRLLEDMCCGDRENAYIDIIALLSPCSVSISDTALATANSWLCSLISGVGAPLLS